MVLCLTKLSYKMGGGSLIGVKSEVDIYDKMFLVCGESRVNDSVNCDMNGISPIKESSWQAKKEAAVNETNLSSPHARRYFPKSVRSS